MDVYVLLHVHQSNEFEDVKFIGVYSTHEQAEAAKERLSLKPGFSSAKDGFYIDKYPVDKDHWIEGYMVIHPE
jgi:homoserine kinase type II